MIKITEKGGNLTETDEFYSVLNSVTDPAERPGDNLDSESYNMFYDSLHQLEANQIISYCSGEVYR